jgi:hypothetical protein
MEGGNGSVAVVVGTNMYYSGSNCGAQSPTIRTFPAPITRHDWHDPA